MLGQPPNVPSVSFLTTALWGNNYSHFTGEETESGRGTHDVLCVEQAPNTISVCIVVGQLRGAPSWKTRHDSNRDREISGSSGL